MNNHMPRTPFSTHLSGSAKETEIRLKNIFSGPKKRPPVLFLILMFTICVFCGNLVSCNVTEAGHTDSELPAPGDYSVPQTFEVEDHAVRAVSVDPDYQPQSAEEEWLLQALFLAANEQQEFQIPKARLVHSIQKDGYVLGAVFVEDYLANTLILGIMDRETHELTGSVFRCDQHVGVLSTVIFQDYDGADCLLYTFNGQMNGQYTGEAGVVRFYGSDMTWTWPVEGNVCYPQNGVQAVAGAREPYQEYWNGRYAVMAPGGVDIYTVNPAFEWGQEDPWNIWRLESGETFWHDPSSAGELPMPVYFDALRWLIDYTNDPAGWRVLSLTRNEEKCDPEGMVDCFTLQAREEGFGTGELTADLYFPYEQEGQRRFYGNLRRGEIYETYNTLPAPLDEP